MTKKVVTYIKYPLLMAGIVLSLLGVAQALTGNIDTTDKWAWSTNAGWINFAPTHGGVTVYPDHLEGYAWAENIGWIRLGTHTGGGTHTYPNTTKDNYGVNNDGNGNLSGYAWGTNVGWINFDPNGDQQVTFDPVSGSFDGYAWAETVGSIHFKNTEAPAYNVVVHLNEIFYVKPSTSGSGDCCDWDNACTLQTALTWAIDGAEIWVAEGTHKPTSDTDRTTTFQLKSGVGVYGGFVATETLRSQRDWEEHETILSGDIGTEGDSSDNSYHVVTGSAGITATAILDGFTISGGNADGADNFSVGGGMFNSNDSSPTLANVIFSGNNAAHGGGMHNDSSSPSVISTTFISNSVVNAGGGMHNYLSSPSVISTTFISNSAFHGGGMFNNDSSPSLTNVTFISNSANDAGGGMHNYLSSPTLASTTFISNSAELYGGGIINNNNSSPTLTATQFISNTAEDGGGMANLDNSSPTLVNAIFSGNTAPDGGGMVNLNSSHPTLTNVSLSGNTAVEEGGGMFNDNSSPTLANSILWGNTATISGTQIYNVSSSPTISFSLVEGSGGSGPGWDPSLGTDGGNNLDADPLFVGSPNDLHLESGSPAIDAGNNSFVPAGVTTDLDGNPRINNDTVDMGAYEFSAPVYLPLILKDSQ